MFFRSLQRRSSNHDCFLHTKLTEFLLNVVFFPCPFIVEHNQYKGRFWSIMFRFSPLENFIATSFLFVYNVHSCCDRLHCDFVIYLFDTHTYVSVGLLNLLITILTMYICVTVAFVLSFLMGSSGFAFGALHFNYLL